MNLVSHFAGGISATSFFTNPQSIQGAMSDQNVFDNILEKQLTLATQEKNNLWNNMGIPAGLEIPTHENIDKINTKTEISCINPTETTSANENMTTSETVAFSSSILNNNLTSQNSSSDIFNYAKKYATHHYSRCAGDVIMDLNEFVNDVLN